MCMAERLMKDDIPHGKICIGFTPDEEVGSGADHFDVKGFGADFAYTVDGGAIAVTDAVAPMMPRTRPETRNAKPPVTVGHGGESVFQCTGDCAELCVQQADRKSTRLNSSH